MTARILDLATARARSRRRKCSACESGTGGSAPNLARVSEIARELSELDYEFGEIDGLYRVRRKSLVLDQLRACGLDLDEDDEGGDAA